MKCDDQPSLTVQLADEDEELAHGNFDEIGAETSLGGRLAIVKSYLRFRVPFGSQYATYLQRAGIREFRCIECQQLHWEIVESNPKHYSDIANRRLSLNNYEVEFEQRWCWNDEDTGEASQEFDSKEAALNADEVIKWSRLLD